MAIKPILFNTEMVRAILDGRKNQTRRVIKPQPMGRLAYCCMGSNAGTWGYPGDRVYEYWGNEWREPAGLTDEERLRRWTPPCHTDDILYVRETWAENPYSDSIYLYRAFPGFEPEDEAMREMGLKWRPSIHMPKEAARIFLRVTDVRVERLQDCGNMQAKDEGCTCCSQFARLWDSTIKPADLDRYGWAANPWVWVIEFERISKEAALGGPNNG